MTYLRRLVPYLRKYKIRLYAGFLVIAISAVFTNLIPFVISKAIDNAKLSGDVSSLGDYAILTVIFAILSGFCLYLTRQFIIVVSREIENDLRNDFFSHILIQDQQYFHSHPTGEIMALATNDISSVRNFLGPGIMYSSETFFNFILAISVMASFNPELTLISLLPIPLISYVVYRIGRSVNKRSESVQGQFSVLTTRVQENLAGIKIVKSYVREAEEIKTFRRLSLDYMKKNLLLARVQSFSYPMMFMLIGMSVIIVIYIGGLKVIDGQLTIGQLTAFIIYLGLLSWPIIALGWIVNLTQRAEASMKRLCNVFDSRPAITVADDSKAKVPDFAVSDIEFRNVSFRYSNEFPYVIRNINLIIKSGEILGITGHTGSGKSTLVNLILRLYDVTEGELIIGGCDIKKIPLGKLRSSVGYVTQDTFLFSDLLENNIAYASPDVNESRIRYVSEIAQLYKDVKNFPGHFKTLLGERGINLSGGQKQRTSLARALYKDPEILILDDAFSAVDTYTEEEILKRLSGVMKNKTVILISHRVSTLKNCDRIIVLQKGSICEEGSHDYLVNSDGLYAEIYQKQLIEEELKEL